MKNMKILMKTIEKHKKNTLKLKEKHEKHEKHENSNENNEKK